MAITVRHSTNAALQYNKANDMNPYMMMNTGTGYPFLTEAPTPRPLNRQEFAFLYFLSGETTLNASIYKAYYTLAGLLISDTYEDIYSIGVHNSFPVNANDAPEEASRMCITLMRNISLFLNGNFAQGDGNLFTNWTLTQPSRTNLLVRSFQFNDPAWIDSIGGTGVSPTRIANSHISPDGNMTADTLIFNTGLGIGGGDMSQIYQSPTIGMGSYTGSIWLKGSFGGEQITIRHVGNSSYNLLTLTNDWVRYKVTEVAGIGNFEFGIRQAVQGTINATATIYAWEAQLEAGSFATPNITTGAVTVTTPLGEFLEDTTGGTNGSRALKMWVTTTGNDTNFKQSVNLVNGTQYRITFKTHIEDFGGSGSAQVKVYINGGLIDVINITESYDTYDVEYISASTSSHEIKFVVENNENYGFAWFDDVAIRSTTQNPISETRCYEIQDSCRGNQVVWLNKLGGYDSFYFTGFPIEQKNIDRTDDIEYPMATNYVSPLRIFASREIISGESLVLFNRCKTRDVAKWLKKHLIDTADAYVIDEDYIPVNVVNTSSEDSELIRNYNVSFTFRHAFNVNIQHR